MNRFRNLTITTKLTLLFILFAILILIGVGALAYFSGRAALEQAVISDLESTANEKQAALNRWFDDRLNLVVSITELPANRARVNSLIHDELDEAARKTLQAQTAQALAGFTGPNGIYTEMMIVEAHQGQVIVSTQPENQGKFNEDRPYFIEGLKGPFVQNVIYSLSERAPVLVVAAPIKADNGSVIAVLAARLKLDEMNDIILRRTGQRETDDALLVDPSNMFVTQPRFITDPAVLQRGVHTEQVNRCLAGDSGAVAANDYRGAPVLAVYRWMPEHQMCLIVKIDQTEAFAPSNSFGRTLALIAIVTLVLASLLGFELARTITTPLRVLQDGVIRFGRGEHDVRLPEMTRDEIGVLAYEFNGMAASLVEKDARLREYTTDLEFKVEERTAVIKEREERYRSYIEVTGQLGWTTNANGEIEEDISSWRKYTGQSEAEVKGWGWSKALHPDDLERAAQAWSIAVATRSNYEIEYRIRRYDGIYRYFLARGVPVVKDEGGILEWVGTCIDITERKRAEDILREDERRLREAQEMAHLGFWLWDIKTGSVEWSEEVFKIFCLDPKGFTPHIDSILAMSPWEEDHQRDKELIDRAIESHTPGSYEQKFLRPDQSIGHYYSTFQGNYDENGDLVSIVGTVLDVTERKQAEEKLIVSEVRYRRLFEAARDGILILEAETGVIVDVNPFLVEMLGVSQEEIRGKALWELGFFQDIAANKANFLELQQKEYIRYEDLPLETAHGRRFNVEFVSNFYQVDHHKVVQCNIRDITERKRAEEALRASEARYRSYIEATGQIGWVTNVDGEVVEDIPSLRKFSGQSYEESKGTGWTKALHPDDLERTLLVWNQVVATKSVYEIEYRMRRYDGVYRHLLARGFPVFKKDGGISEWVGTCIDITERKLMEKALKESEERWRRAIVDSPIPIMIHDEDDRVLQLSVGWTKFSGYDIDDIPTLADWTERAYGERTGFKKDYIDQLFSINQTVQNGEWIVTAKDGSKRIWDFQTTPLGKGSQGRRILHSMAIDITERKQAEVALAANQKLFQDVTDNSTALIYSLDLDGRFLLINRSLETVFGVPRETLIGKTREAILPLEIAANHRANDLHVIAQRVSVTYEEENDEPDGKHTYLSVKFPLLDFYGNVCGIGGISTDITTRRQAEDALQEYNTRLETEVEQRTHELREIQEQLVRQERLATLGQLAGSIGHELRNPLGVISNAVYFLKLSQPDASDKVKDYLDIIEKETLTSDKIVTDLLDFTRIKSLDRQPVSVSELLDQTLERHPAPESVKVTLEIPADLPQIYADPQHIIQVFGNLILNAYQSMKSSNGTTNGGKLTVSAAAQSAMIKIEIQDMGVGIPPENMKKLFEPLFTTKTKGIGLGLAVSRKLTEANGGRIEVESEAGKGSTFTVYLPVYKES